MHYRGIDMPGLNLADVRRLPVALPPLPEQQEIACRVAELFALAEKIETRVQSATAAVEKLVQATLAKAFRGELVPTETELAKQEGRAFETAEQLLERIRAARASAASSPSRPSRRSFSQNTGDVATQTFPENLFAERPATRQNKSQQASERSRKTSESSERPKKPQNGEEWVEITYDDAMAYVRTAFAEGGARDRDQSIKDLATALGFQRVGSRVRDDVDGYLRAAVRRGILSNDGGMYALLVRSAADYSRDHLIDALMASMNGGWTDREAAVRATAKHLGFQKAGTAFKEAMKSAINGAIRRRLVEVAGPRLRRCR
jgi:hypothetical protein